MTGRTDNSSVSDTHYNYARTAANGGRGGSAGPAALSESTTFGVDDLRRLIPLRATASRQLEIIREEADEEEHEDNESGVTSSTSLARPKRATRLPKTLESYSLTLPSTRR